MNDLRKAAKTTLFRLLGDENHDIRLRAAIALLQALAESEQYDQTALELCEKCGWKAIIPDEGCLVCARNEQEPVAWMTINEYGEEDDIHYENPEGHLLEGWTYKPLYTAPPKKEWVGLTKEDFLAELEDPRIVELRTLMAEPGVTGVIFEVHRGPLSKSIREYGECPCPTHVEGDVRIEVKE